MKQILLLFLFFAGLNLSAQVPLQKITIKGFVIDSVTNQPLGYTTVVLTDVSNSKLVISSLTKDDGFFELNATRNKQYTISFVYIAYLSKIIPIRTGEKSEIIDLGKIKLAASPGQLKEVAITAVKPILKKEIDRISYDVQADPESKANDALEMLRKVPMVTVDGSDNIQLNGSSSYRIFINGKPSALMTNDPAEVLKSMPAVTILKIEVITIPPSKYDSEGLAGIINIITVKKNDDGITGQAFARYNNRLGERGNISLAAKQGKFSLNTFFALSYQKYSSTASGSQLITYSPATNLVQQGQNINNGNVNNGLAQVDYTADSLNLFTVSLDFSNRDFIRNTSRNSQLFSADTLAQAYLLSNNGKNSNNNFDVDAGYQLGFKKNKDELLTFLYQFSYGANDENNSVTTTGTFNYNNPDYNQQNNIGSKEHTFQVDFSDPMKTATFETGAKAILRQNNSSFEEENMDPVTGNYMIDTSLTNLFNYRQNVYSLYGTYQLKFGNWVIKAGVRAEGTVINGGLTGNDNSVDQRYINYIPALSIQRTYSGAGSVTFGYTERIQRPGINQLDPFTDRSDPEFITTGNPDLRPVLNHIIELSYSKFGKGGINAGLNYSFASNVIQNVTSLINDTVTESTYLNVGTSRSAGFNLSTNYPITDRLNFNLNAQLSYIWLTGQYDGQLYKNQGIQGNITAFAGYNFANNWRTVINFGYYGDNIYLQGKSSDYIYNTLVIIKDFLNRRATVSLTIYEPYAAYSTYSNYTQTPAFRQSMYSQDFYRMFRFGFNYKFGKINSSTSPARKSIINNGKNENIENQ